MARNKSRNKKTDNVSKEKQKPNESQIIEAKTEVDKEKQPQNDVNISQRSRSKENITFRPFWKLSKAEPGTIRASSSQNQIPCAPAITVKQCSIITVDNHSISNEMRDYRTRRSEPAQSSSRRESLSYRQSTNRSFDYQRTPEGSDFYQFENCFRRNTKLHYAVEEVEKNLFDMPPTFSLVHCVAEDMNMGSGIAVEFRHKFKQVANLLNQHVKTGGVAILKDQNRFLYYLVTKMFSPGKPTYRTLFSSLEALRSHVMENNVKALAMPTIGCGLDRLEWVKVKFMIEYIFQNVDIQIIICSLQITTEMSPQKHLNCKLQNETYPIEKIEDGTIILFLSPEEYFVSNEMRELNKRFEFSHVFDNFRKVVGTVFFYPTKNVENLLCGCIVKQRTKDSLDFVAFEACLQKIKKENRKYNFHYIAMQAFRDEADPCIMFKIINILRNTMRDVEVYICWPEDLQQDLLAREPRNSYNEQFKRRTLSPADLRPNETEFNVNRTETESGVSKSRNIEDKVPIEPFDEKKLADESECWDTRNEELIEETSLDNTLNESFGETFSKQTLDEVEQVDNWESLVENKPVSSEDLINISKTVPCENLDLFDQFLSEKANLQLKKIRKRTAYDKCSRVCFVREDLVFESGIPKGSDVTNLIGRLLDEKLEEGNCVFVEDGKEFFFCLVISNMKKPTAAKNIFVSVEKLRDYVMERQLKQLVIAVINKKEFEWTEIEYMFEFLFKDVDIDLIVDLHPEEHQLSVAKFKHVKFPIQRMKEKSILLYLASTDNIYTHSMVNLRQKFGRFNPQVEEEARTGDVTIYKPNDYFAVYGCLVKKASDDPISFEALQQCLQKVKSENIKENFNFAYLQAENRDENNANYKIITLLLTCLPECTVFLGWPGHLLKKMPTDTL